jgi:hypothetical protein
MSASPSTPPPPPPQPAADDPSEAPPDSAPSQAKAHVATRDVLETSLLGLLTPMVSKCDKGIQDALSSQEALSTQIDRVAAELQRFLGNSQLPSLSPHAQKLADLRHRVSVSNNTLVQVQQRLGRIQDIADRVMEEERLTMLKSAGAPTSLGAGGTSSAAPGDPLLVTAQRVAGEARGGGTPGRAL